MENKGRICWHTKRYGFGVIQNEMNTFNPPQWGCVWNIYASTTKFSWHNYWNDKSEIRILGESTFDKLADEFNFKTSQAEYLFNLCDNDLLKFEYLLLTLKSKHLTPPGTPYELEMTFKLKTYISWEK